MNLITEEHKAFARDMVALARARCVGAVMLTFKLDIPREGPWHSQEVTIIWETGRHGEAGEIKLSAHETVRASEKLNETE